jgi:hypothetical protein
MSALWQTVIPAALTALVAGRVAWTRTSRLRRTIATNLDLLGRLSADHPNRAALEATTGSCWACWSAGSSDVSDRSHRPGFPSAPSLVWPAWRW